MSNATETAQTPTFAPFEDIVSKYAKADKGDKARIRTSTTKKAMDAMLAGDLDLAGRLSATVKALVTEKATVEIDHAALAASSLAVILAAKSAVEAYAKEHGVAEIATVEADSDKADKLVKSLLSVKAPRESIDGVFERAFEGLEVGSVLKVSQICAKGATADYTPGSGAVAARLRGDAPQTLTEACSVEGIEPVWVATDGTVSASWSPSVNVGARKVA